MRQYAVAVAVVLFWANSMRQLAVREVLPALRESSQAAQGLRYSEFQRSLIGPQRLRMAIFVTRKVDDKPEMRPVGSLERFVQPREEGFTLITMVSLDVGSLAPTAGVGPSLPTRTVFEVQVDRGKLTAVEATTRVEGSAWPWLEASGRVAGDKLNLVIRSGATEMRRTVPFNADYFLDGSAWSLSGIPRLHVGKRWMVRTFDPITAKVAHAEARATGRERIVWQKEEVECYVVEIGTGPLRSTSWVDDLGRVLQHRVMALTFVLERPSPRPMGRGHD